MIPNKQTTTKVDPNPYFSHLFFTKFAPVVRARIESKRIVEDISILPCSKVCGVAEIGVCCCPNPAVRVSLASCQVGKFPKYHHRQLPDLHQKDPFNNSLPQPKIPATPIRTNAINVHSSPRRMRLFLTAIKAVLNKMIAKPNIAGERFI